MLELLAQAVTAIIRWFRPRDSEDTARIFSVGKWRMCPVLILGFGLLNTILAVALRGKIGLVLGGVYVLLAYVVTMFLDYDDEESPLLTYPMIFFEWAATAMVVLNFFTTLWILGEIHLIEQKEIEHQARYVAWEKKDKEYDAKLTQARLNQEARDERELRKLDKQLEINKSNERAAKWTAITSTNVVKLNRQTGQKGTIAFPLGSAGEDGAPLTQEKQTEDVGKREMPPVNVEVSSKDFSSLWQRRAEWIIGGESGFVMLGILWLKLFSTIDNRRRKKPEEREVALPRSEAKIEVSPAPSENVKNEVSDEVRRPDGPDGTSPNDLAQAMDQSKPGQIDGPEVARKRTTTVICNGLYKLAPRTPKGWRLRDPNGVSDKDREKGPVTDDEADAIFTADLKEQERLVRIILQKNGKLAQANVESILARRAAG